MQFVADPRFEEVKAFVRSGAFGANSYEELMGSLEGNEGYGRADYFLVGKDFPSYIECQDRVDEAYRDQKVSNFFTFFILFDFMYVHQCMLFFYDWNAELDKDVYTKHSWFFKV